jgi:hypothetical protein
MRAAVSLGPHPLVLHAVAKALDLSEVNLFQLAGYISDEPAETRMESLSASAIYLGWRFDRLPDPQKKVIWEVMRSMEKASGLLPPDEWIKQVSEAVERLRRAHPIFIKRSMSRREMFGVYGGLFTRTSTPHVLASGIEHRLKPLIPDRTLTQDEIIRVANSYAVATALNILLPRKDIPDALEKLYWLVVVEKEEDSRGQPLHPERREALKALWLLLERLAAHPDTLQEVPEA